jgi:phage-related protein (TIGR01555 family)
MDAIKRHDGTVANVAGLLYEARLDVITIPGLAALVSDPAEEAAFVKRIQSMRAMAGNFGTVLLNGSTTPGDPSETWEQKNFSFATLPDIITKAQEEVSAAARIPRAILFGTGAGGLGATGDLELSAYYDRINSIQTNEFEPAMAILDECLIRHALGNRPAELWYEWRSLWQMSDKEKSEIADRTTAAIDKFVTAMSKAPEYMAESMINAVTEIGLLPGLEVSYADWVAAGGADNEDASDMTPGEQDTEEENNGNR